MDKKKRFFMIMFSGLSEDNTLRTGKIEYRTNDGRHANELVVLALITKQFGLSQVFVKGVMEMAEQDFMDWIDGRDDTPPQLPEHTDDDGGFL
jgi:hypothetical protein